MTKAAPEAVALTARQSRFKISDAKAIATQRDLQAVVVLTVERDGTVSVVSYGESKAKCQAIGEWAQGLWSYAVSIRPFQTVFGWGNGGKPKPADKREYL